MGIIRQLFTENSNKPALEQLFAIYYDRLVFFSWQIVKNKQQAEDAVQDAFIAYWKQRDDIAAHPVAVKNFLYRSVKNNSLNIIRHEQVVNQYITKQDAAEPGEAYILESIISAELIAEIHAAINSLPEHLQTLSRLSFLEGKKNQEVADELNRSVNTVKKQKQRVLDLLKLKLSPEVFVLFVGFTGLLHK